MKKVLIMSSGSGREHHKVDYTVMQSDPFDDTTEIFMTNLAKAKAYARKMAKETNAEWQIMKWVDEEPADFAPITYWYVTPDGKWSTQ